MANDKDQDGLLGALITRDRRDEIKSHLPAFVREHPVGSSIATVVIVINIAPPAMFVGVVVATILFCISIAGLVIASVTIIPALVIGAFIWACYTTARWASGLVLRGAVGSDNEVMMRPSAEASGNETHGNLEVNLIKLQDKKDGEPELKA